MGYSVRGEARRTPATAVEYCTTGLVLRRLQEPGALAGVSHVVVDEVHERSADCDLLLLFLPVWRCYAIDTLLAGGFPRRFLRRLEGGRRRLCSCRRPSTRRRSRPTSAATRP